MSQDTGYTDSLLTSNDPFEEESRRRRQKVLALLRGRYHWAIAAALLLGVAGGLIGYFAQAPYYTSHGRVEITQDQDIFGNVDRHIGPIFWNEFVNTKMALIKSPAAAAKAMASERWQRDVGALGLEFTTSEFQDAVEIERGSKSNILDVSFTHDVNTVAAAGLESAINAFLEVFQDQRLSDDAIKLKALAERRSGLEFDRRRLEENRRTAAGGDFTSAVLEPQHKWALNEQMRLQTELNGIERHLAGLSDEANLREMAESDLIAIDSTLSNLQIQLTAVDQEIKKRELLGQSRNHWGVKQLLAQKTSLQTQMADRVTSLRNGLAIPDGGNSLAGGSNVDQLKARHSQLKAELEAASSRTAEENQRLQNVLRIEDQMAKIDSELGRIAAAVEQIDIDKAIGGQLRVISRGYLPEEPSNGDTRIRYAAAGSVAGILAGIGLVMLVGAMDRRLRHIEDAQLDLPQARMLGILPTLPADLHDPEQAVLVAHSVHHVRTLLQIGREPCGNVFSVTSPAAGSGKTSLSMALGLSFASSGCKTLLIDADIVGGGLTRRMGFVVHPRLGQVLRQRGLVTETQIADALRVAESTGARIGEALVSLGYVAQRDVEHALELQKTESIGLVEACGEHRFEECIAPTGIRNLYVLPIGTALPQHAGALSPSALRRIIAQARTQYDTVLIDTGPLLGSLEASMAAAEADGTVLIVSRGDQKPLIQKCVQHLQQINGRLLGVVFNHALAHDIARSTYGSVTMSQSRHPNNSARVEAIDADTSARFGPLATAVASYAASADGRGDNMARRNRPTDAADALAAAHAGNGNGRHGSNGHAD